MNTLLQIPGDRAGEEDFEGQWQIPGDRGRRGSGDQNSKAIGIASSPGKLEILSGSLMSR